MDVAFFTEVDTEALAVELSPSDAEIAAELLETENVSNDNDDATDPEDEPVYCPNRNELL